MAACVLVLARMLDMMLHSIRLRLLLIELRLNTTLQRLALVVLRLRFSLRLTVARETCYSAADGAGHAICNTRTEIAELTAGFLSLAFSILLLAFALQTLGTDETAQGFLAGADGLVPGTGLTVWVIGRDAGGADGDTAYVAAYVGQRVLGIGLSLLVFALGLECRLACVTVQIFEAEGACLVSLVTSDGAKD
jgi:hypothetical protein